MMPFGWRLPLFRSGCLPPGWTKDLHGLSGYFPSPAATMLAAPMPWRKRVPCYFGSATMSVRVPSSTRLLSLVGKPTILRWWRSPWQT